MTGSSAFGFVPIVNGAFVTRSNAFSEPQIQTRPANSCATPKASVRDFSTTTKLAAAAAAAAIVALSPAEISIDQSPHHALHYSPVAEAKAARGGGASFLSASGEVIKDPESLLRWSLPINNRAVRELQSELESAITDTRGLKWPKIDQHVKKGSMVLKNQTTSIMKDVPEDRRQEVEVLLDKVTEGLPAVEIGIVEKNVDKVIKGSRDILRDVGKIEELMVKGFPFDIPAEYANLPQLKGRATVEMEVRKADDEPFDIEGTIYKEGKMTLVLDGYSAPVSAGTFLDLVNKGFYNNGTVIRSDGFIIQTGKPTEGEGYVDEKSGAIRTIPLEVFAKGDKQPTYGLTLEEDGRGASGTVLPFTSYGTLAMARGEFEPNSASSQFFWFLFEPDLTPAGRNLMDGSWAVFGYTTKGESFLKGLQKGDRIVSARVIDGLDNLVST